MASSSYYYSQMLEYGRKKRISEEKEAEYEKYLKKLNELEEKLSDAVDDFVNSESNFKNGGFVVDNIPIGNDTLNKCYKSLDNAITTLESVISNTKSRLNDFVQDVNKYTRLYKEANENYRDAKRKESN